MKLPVRFSRHLEIQKARDNLEINGLPRLQMTLLVVLTGLAGLFSSFLLLHAGLVTMWLRYLVSFGFAYLAFLFLLWLWLRTNAEDYSDIPDVGGSFPSSSSSAHAEACSCYSGEGGTFGGGGASSSFDASIGDASIAGDASPIGEAIGNAAAAEEFAIPLVVLILIGVMLLSTLFMIYSAPMLFAELMVDGVLSASLYHKLRGLETRHWVETAVRRTSWPFALTTIIVSIAGWSMSLYAPEAHTLGEVLYHAHHLAK